MIWNFRASQEYSRIHTVIVMCAHPPASDRLHHSPYIYIYISKRYVYTKCAWAPIDILPLEQPQTFVCYRTIGSILSPRWYWQLIKCVHRRQLSSTSANCKTSARCKQLPSLKCHARSNHNSSAAVDAVPECTRNKYNMHIHKRQRQK